MSKPEKLWNPGYISFILLQTLNFSLLYFTFPVIPKYATSLGYDLSQAGMLASGFAIASLLSRPITGFCIDNIDRKKVLILSLFACGLSTAALTVSDNIWIMLIFRLIYGSAFAFSSTTFLSCGIDCIPEKQTGEGVGYFGLGIALSAAIGPPIGLYLNDRVGAKALFLIMCAISILVIVAVFFIPIPVREKVPVKQRKKIGISDFIDKKVIIFAVLVIPFSFSNGFVNSFIAMTADERHVAGIGIFFTAYAVMMMVLKPLSGKVQDRFGLSAALIPAFICAGVGTGIIALAYSLFLFIVAAFLLAFGQGAGQPALQAATVSEVEETRRGVAIGTYYIGLDAGIGIGNLAGSSVAERFGYAGGYWLCASTLLSGLVIYLVYITLKAKKHS